MFGALQDIEVKTKGRSFSLHCEARNCSVADTVQNLLEHALIVRRVRMRTYETEMKGNFTLGLFSERNTAVVV